MLNKAMTVFVLSAAVFHASAAQAQAAGSRLDDEREEAHVDHEWSIGVPRERRAAARALFDEGNSLLLESLTFAAAEKLSEAIELWDHPGIHYNLALAIMTLDRPLELREHLEAAMKYGELPLTAAHFTNAKRIRAMLEQQLIRIRVKCDVAGAKVSFDGEELLEPPGEVERWARPGRHVIAATKEGFVANQVARAFEPGTITQLDLELATQEGLTEYRRRWSVKVPWTFMGAGAAVSLVGGGMFAAARMKANDADRIGRDQCPTGCTSPPSGDNVKRTQSATLQKAAFAAFAVGGAAIVAGGVLAFFNQAEAVVRRYEPDVTPEATPKVGLAPYLDTNTQSVVALGTF